MTSVHEDWLCTARKAKRLALIAHVSPDGDTVGATLALRLAFLSLGKAVDVVCDGVSSVRTPTARTRLICWKSTLLRA